jgi:hypothetical protein
LGSPPATRSLLGSALRYSIPTIPNTISVSVLAVGDRIVIQAISGSSAVGKYQIANAFGRWSSASWSPSRMLDPDHIRCLREAALGDARQDSRAGDSARRWAPMCWHCSHCRSSRSLFPATTTPITSPTSHPSRCWPTCRS